MTITAEEIAYRRGDRSAIERERQRMAAREAGKTVDLPAWGEAAAEVDPPAAEPDDEVVPAGPAEDRAPMSIEEARDLTDQIRQAAEHLWSLLEQAHYQQAWRALGYGTWADYVRTEFSMSRQRSYQVLDQAHVIRELTAAVSTDVDTVASVIVSEASARDLKPHVEEVAEEVATAMQDFDAREPEATPERRGEIAQEVVSGERERIRSERQTATQAQVPDEVIPSPPEGGLVAQAEERRERRREEVRANRIRQPRPETPAPPVPTEDERSAAVSRKLDLVSQLCGEMGSIPPEEVARHGAAWDSQALAAIHALEEFRAGLGLAA